MNENIVAGGGAPAVRGITFVAVLAALLLALTVGTAPAALNKINCPNKDDNRCVGTPSKRTS